MDWLLNWLGLFWVFAKRHPGIVMVLIGVVIEGWEIVSKIAFKPWFQKHEFKIEIVSAVGWLILVIGLAFEIPDAATDDKETEKLHQANLVLSSNLVVAETKLVELRAELSDRMIDGRFGAVLATRPKGKAEIVFNNSNGEAYRLATGIHYELLKHSWTVNEPIGKAATGNHSFLMQYGLFEKSNRIGDTHGIGVLTTENLPSRPYDDDGTATSAIMAAFQANGMRPVIGKPPETILQSNLIRIVIDSRF